MGIIFTLLILFFFWSLVSYLAFKRGRDPTGWYFIAILLGIFSIPLLYFLPRKEEVLHKPAKEEPDPLQGKQWYYLNQKKSIEGPFSSKRVRTLLSGGEITLKTLVWSEGMKDWQSLEQIVR